MNKQNNNSEQVSAFGITPIKVKPELPLSGSPLSMESIAKLQEVEEAKSKKVSHLKHK